MTFEISKQTAKISFDLELAPRPRTPKCHFLGALRLPVRSLCSPPRGALRAWGQHEPTAAAALLASATIGDGGRGLSRGAARVGDIDGQFVRQCRSCPPQPPAVDKIVSE